MKKIFNFFFYIIIIMFLLTLFIHPNEIFVACKSGIQLWFNIIFPSLFPFIVIINLIMNSRLVIYFNKLLNFIMYPLFRVNGIGSIAFLMGNISGFPLGAKIVADLEKKKYISPIESQRLISFCNNCGPIFIISAVCGSMFNIPRLAWYIILIQLLSSISVGIIFRFYKYKNDNFNSNINELKIENISFSKNITSSINNAIETILHIGSFIIFFSVFIKFIQISNINSILNLFFIPIENILSIHPNLKGSISYGFIEITNGLNYASGVYAPLLHKILLTNLIINWGSLSVHAQTLEVIKDTQIKFKTYLLAKGLQSIFALIYSLLFIFI